MPCLSEGLLRVIDGPENWCSHLNIHVSDDQCIQTSLPVGNGGLPWAFVVPKCWQLTPIWHQPLVREASSQDGLLHDGCNFHRSIGSGSYY